tara:strand:+ start:1512 stop:1763 length:252 start_codon:yes stop_codon:yes gene_type:complete
LSSINLNNYRNQLGFVFQETFLFHGTIKENILLTKPKSEQKELETALKNANVIEFINDLPNGIDSLIGEGGNKLSVLKNNGYK